MKNLRIILITISVAVAVAGSSWLGYALFQRIQRPSESPFNAIPGNTALIIKLNKAGNLLEELNRSNLLWKALMRFPGINNVRSELSYVDSASKKNDKIGKIFQQYSIYVSITLSGRTNFGALYLANVSGSDPASYIEDFITEIGAGKLIITETPYFTTNLHRVQTRGSRETFYFAVLKGVFIGSFHADLVKRSIDRLSLNTPLATSSGFKRVEATTGKKVDANVYVNYRFFSLVLSKITHDETLPDLLKFSNFADWSGLDLIIKKDELLFNGITVASDSNQQFLALFTDQKPQKKEISVIIPDKVLYFTSYGWSDPSRFCQRFQGRTPRYENFSAEQTTVFTLIEQYQLNIKEYFLPWMGNEAALFILNDTKTLEELPFVAFNTLDTARTISSVFALADTLNLTRDSLVYKRHKIYKVSLPAFLPALFGDLFGKVNVNCFTVLKGFVIFANRPKDLEMVIDAVIGNSTLSMDKVYVDFEGALSEKSNVFCYFNTRNAIHSLKKIMNQEISGKINPVSDSLRKFESVAFQYSSVDGLFYSNFFLRYNPNLDKDGPMQWQVKLDTTIIGHPRIIPVGTTGDNGVIVNDIANNLYLVTAAGQVAWKLHIMGKLLGEIHPIRMGVGDSLYYMFNTDTHLYMIGSDGQFADKYPMRFPLKATNGISIADWNHNRDYNILVAFQDNRVYNFNLDGRSVMNWKRPRLNEEISDPVQTRTVGAKNFILISGLTGTTLIVDPNGDQKIIPGPNFTHASSSVIYNNKTNKKGIFLTTDPNGKVIFIQENGRILEVTLNLFSPAHHFFYEDITGNGQPEFIFTDRNKIFYYNRNYKLIYSYAFRREMNGAPFLLHGRDNKVLIGYVVPETNELFLFDHHGNREMEAGIRGNTPFDVGDLGNTGQMNLVVGFGKFLKNYRLP